MQTRKWLLPVAAFYMISLGLFLFLRFGAGGGTDRSATISASEQTVALYDEAVTLLEARRDAEAVALLQKAFDRPLDLPESPSAESTSRNVSTGSRLIFLSRTLCARAMNEIRIGDRAEALGWVTQVRHLAAQVVATRSPSLYALLTVRALDTQASRVEMALAKGAEASMESARYTRSETALRAFYEREIMPEVMAARKRREDEKQRIARQYASAGKQQAQALEQVERRLNKSDAELAASLLRRYASERLRAVLLAGRLVPNSYPNVSQAAAAAPARAAAAPI